MTDAPKKRVRPSKPYPRTPATPESRARARANRVPQVVSLREQTALELYVKCKTQREIAEIMGVSQPTVHRMIQQGLAKRAPEIREITEQARVLVADRLEAVLSTWMPLALGGNPTEGGPPPSDKAADIVLKTIDRLARIYGVDTAPPPVAPDAAIAVNIDAMRRDIMASLEHAASRAQEAPDIIQGVIVRTESN